MILVWLMILAATSVTMAIRAIQCRAAARRYEDLLARHVKHQHQSLETRYTELKTSLRKL